MTRSHAVRRDLAHKGARCDTLAEAPEADILRRFEQWKFRSVVGACRGPASRRGCGARIGRERDDDRLKSQHSLARGDV